MSQDGKARMSGFTTRVGSDKLGEVITMRRFTTYQEEAKAQREAFLEDARLHGPFYTYRPGLLDLFRPNVIRGDAIAEGARVYITRHRVDPLEKIVWIRDAAGNEQSVWKKALIREVK